jgi:hypothetical protein
MRHELFIKHRDIRNRQTRRKHSTTPSRLSPKQYLAVTGSHCGQDRLLFAWSRSVAGARRGSERGDMRGGHAGQRGDELVIGRGSG